ncbi:hypothetical protein ABZY19_04860 [Streptomyces sp. NPDC006475]|uniref:hypothetical protein n=1 Tax=Streptomyces sp. NPDC006475 TaxID=3155719 RepID=UPI0033B24D40
MRKTLLAAVVTAATCLALTACQGGAEAGGGDAAPSTTRPLPTASATPASATPTPAGDESGPTDAGPAALDLGEPSRTVGARTVGILEITPTSVVYADEGAGAKPQAGVFAVVTMKEKSLSANPAAEELPATGGGWEWLTPDGQKIPAGNGNAGQVALDGYDSSGPVEPGATRMGAKVFDLTPAQARSGRIVYTDGVQASYRWKMPADSTGPEVADVEGQLAS